MALNKTREIKPAEVIEKQILARGKRALVVYGAGHYLPSISNSIEEKLQKADWSYPEWSDTIRRDYPGALYVVLFYGGTKNRTCSQDLEGGMAGWPVPALATPLKGSELAAKLAACSTLKAEDMGVPPVLTDAEKQEVFNFYRESASQGDALIYLGPSATLTYSPYIPDLYLDLDYDRTVARHHELQTGEKFPTYPVKDYTIPAKKVYP